MMWEGVDKEKQVVKKLNSLFLETKPSSLRKMFAHTNLATRGFHQLWTDWWKEAIPPRLEVDMILVFDDPAKIDKVFTVGIEVKFFKGETRNFYDGLQQALSFGLFGFDSLVLWHIFPPESKNKEIDEYVKPVKEMMEGFPLPIVYLATKLTEDGKFEFFAPWEFYSSSKVDATYLLNSIRDLYSKKRNPLLDKKEVEKRKEILKVLLKIPI